jgi:hypothetical protein
MDIDYKKITNAINMLSAEGIKIDITSLAKTSGYSYQQLYMTGYKVLVRGWNLKIRSSTFWLDNEYLGLSYKFKTRDLHEGGFWFIHQQGEQHPFMTCNPAYIRAYKHLFISYEFIKVQ